MILNKMKEQVLNHYETLENKKRNDCLLLYEKDCVSLQKIDLKQKNNPSKSLTL